jgi:hypothetical protein
MNSGEHPRALAIFRSVGALGFREVLPMMLEIAPCVIPILVANST